MFNLQGGELIIVALLALVVLGPEKLPEAARWIGRMYAQLKRMGDGFAQEVRSSIDEPMREVRGLADDLRDSLHDLAVAEPSIEVDGGVLDTNDETPESEVD